MAMTSMPLPPGFRFHPTDVELVKYYLKRKVLGKKFRFDAIADVDIYKHAPWDLPDKSALRSKDLKWYFFCARGKKYATGGRMNRATDFGYWKATGKDRPIDYNNEVVGKIKTLVFHRGKPPKGDRTDWVIHEYRLEDKDLADKGVVQDAYVLCVVFQKDGPGPRNGAQYGAPFSEEDWSDDDDEEVDCGGAASSDGLSGPGFVLPNNQISSVATSEGMCIETTSESCPSNTLPSSAGLSGPGVVLPNNQISYVATTSHLPEGMCIGTSESCLSNTLPSSANLSGPGFGLPNNEISSVVTTPHLPEGMCIGTISESYLSNTLPSCNVLPTVSGVPVEAPQVQNDEVLDLDLMLDCLVEDVTLVSNENNSNEELDNLSRDGNVEDPSFGLDGNGNDFFKGLEDLDNMGGLIEGGYDFSSGYRPAYTPQMLYLELQDLDDPQHVFGLNQSPPMLPGEPHGFEDHVDVFHEGNGASGSVNQGYGSCEAALDNWVDAPF